MPSISIQLYRIRIKEVRKDGWLAFSRGGACDLYALLKKYFHERQGKLVNLRNYAVRPEVSKERRTLRVGTIKSYDDKARLSVMVSGGDYGTTSDLLDIDSGESVHKKKVSETEMAPFFCAFDIPDGATQAYLACECKGARGIKGALEKDLKKWLSTYDLVIAIDVLTDREALLEFLTPQSTFDAVTVRSIRRPKESRAILKKTRLGQQELGEGTEIEVKIKKTPEALNALKKMLKKCIQEEEDPRDLIVIEGLPDVDELTAELTNADGKTRAFNLCNPQNACYRYCIDDDVRLGNSGHPVFDCIEEVAYSHIDDIRG